MPVPGGAEPADVEFGAHFMLMDLQRPLQQGERVPLTLKLEPGGKLQVDLTVEPLGARRPARRP